MDSRLIENLNRIHSFKSPPILYEFYERLKLKKKATQHFIAAYGRQQPAWKNREYATLFLNSPIGLAQSEMYQTGSSGQLHLYPHHIQEFLIYIPLNKNGSVDLAWQKILADKVVGGSRAKQEAQTKLTKQSG